MKTMNDGSQVLSATPESGKPFVITSSYIPIISSTAPNSTSPNTHQNPDSIESYSLYHSSLPFTKRSKQKTSSQSLLPVLQAFLYGDLTSSLPEFGKWKTWSSIRGYTNSRIIISGNRLHLLASSKKGDLDIYALPYSRGGVRQPVLRKTFTSVQIGILNQMLGCQNVSGGYEYCGYCPSCLGFHTDRKVFVNKRADIRKLESEVEELREYIRLGDGMIRSLRLKLVQEEKRGFMGLARVLSKRIVLLEGCIDDPAKHLRMREIELDRLSGSHRRELKEHSKLIQEPHWFISVSCPTPLHVLYEAQDAWLAGRVLVHGRRASEGLQRILGHLAGKESGFVELMRFVFRKLVVEAVQAQHPEIELTMEHQMHPFNKWDSAPDVHFLVCRKTQDKSGRVVEVSFDARALRLELESRMRTFAGFAVWAVKRWNGGCRAAEFKRWRRDLLAAAEAVRVSGIPEASVDVRLVPVPELLNTHSYLRRQPMENVQKLCLSPKAGTVAVGYWGGRSARFGVAELLWRFVGFDGRGLGVQYSGAYRSGRGLKRNRKVDDLYREREEQAKVPAGRIESAQAAITLPTEGPGL